MFELMSWIATTISAFVAVIFAATIGYFVCEYFKFHFQSHILKWIEWRLKKWYQAGDEWKGVFNEFKIDLRGKSTWQKIQLSLLFLQSLKPADKVEPPDQEID